MNCSKDMMYEKLDNLCCQLLDSITGHFGKGIDQVDTKEAGEVFDMIKDIAYAKKLCAETEYYETVTTAMHGESANNPFDDQMMYSGMTPYHEPMTYMGIMPRREPMMYGDPMYYGDPTYSDSRMYSDEGTVYSGQRAFPSRKPYVDQMPYVHNYLHGDNPNKIETPEDIMDMIHDIRAHRSVLDATSSREVKAELTKLINEM